MIKSIVAAILIWPALPLHAQQYPPNTLGNIWLQAEANYPAVTAQSALVEAAEFNEKSTFQNKLPKVNAQLQNTYGNFKGSTGGFFSEPGVFNISGNAGANNGQTHPIAMASSNFASTTLDWTLYSFKNIQTEIKVAHLETQAAKNQFQGYLLELKQQVSNKYIQLLYDNALYDWATANVQRLTEIQSIAASLSAAGIKPAADSLLSAAALLQAKGSSDKWRGQKKAALINLQALIGEQSIDYKASSQRFIKPESIGRFTNTQIPSTHPSLQSLQQRADDYRLLAQLEKNKALPSLKLLAGYSLRSSAIQADGTYTNNWTDGFNNKAGNFLAGLAVTWNITNIATNRTKQNIYLKKASSKKESLAANLIALKASLAATNGQIEESLQEVQKYNQAVSQATKAYGMYLARYKSGLISLSELLQISQLLEEAQQIQMGALLHYWQLQTKKSVLTDDFSALFTHL